MIDCWGKPREERRGEGGQGAIYGPYLKYAPLNSSVSLLVLDPDEDIEYDGGSNEDEAAKAMESGDEFDSLSRCRCRYHARHNLSGFIVPSNLP